MRYEEALKQQKLSPVHSALTRAGFTPEVEYTGGGNVAVTVKVPAGTVAVAAVGDDTYYVGMMPGNTWHEGPVEAAIDYDDQPLIDVVELVRYYATEVTYTDADGHVWVFNVYEPHGEPEAVPEAVMAVVREDEDRAYNVDVAAPRTRDTLRAAVRGFYAEYFGPARAAREDSGEPVDRSYPHVYCVGLPVVVTVAEDGTVTYEVDTAEAGLAISRECDDAREHYGDAAIERDAETVDRDHARRWQRQQQEGSR